jgi:hypothetical protein
MNIDPLWFLVGALVLIIIELATMVRRAHETGVLAGRLMEMRAHGYAPRTGDDIQPKRTNPTVPSP